MNFNSFCVVVGKISSESTPLDEKLNQESVQANYITVEVEDDPFIQEEHHHSPFYDEGDDAQSPPPSEAEAPQPPSHSLQASKKRTSTRTRATLGASTV